MSFKITNISLVKKCLRNVEEVRNICKFRNYKQQYQMAQVSDTLEKIIFNYIFKTKFKTVEIQIYSENDFIVMNIIDNKMLQLNDIPTRYNLMAKSAIHFNADDVDIFVNLNKNNIKKLKIVAKTSIYESLFLKEDLTNLRYLDLKSIKITNQQLQNVANNCKHLEALNLDDCHNEYSERQMFNNDECLQIIKTMHNLRYLKLTALTSNNVVVKIVNELNLEHLVLNFVYDEDKEVEGHQVNLNKLKVYKRLQVGHIIDTLYFQSNFLANFENLKNLYVRNENIRYDFFKLLQDLYGNLTVLSFVNCSVLHFTALPTLMVLRIEFCSRFTYANLKTILHEMNIRSFSAICTPFEGHFEPFYLSPTLEICRLDHFIIKKNVKKLFQFNFGTYLMNLRKFSFDVCWTIDLRLLFCPNLQELYINMSCINIKDILQLKYLQKVVITRCYSDDMSKLNQLLRNENLKELSIMNYCISEPIQQNRTKLDPITTNLLYFNIPERMMEHARDFVLDLLNVNEKLSLRCAWSSSSCLLSGIKSILRSKNFPKRFKSINICGFLMDCASAADGSLESMEFFKFLRENYYFILE